MSLFTRRLQTRKLALQLCDLLFARSKAFRRLLTAQFGQFVELTVGHKSDKPLPAPPAAAIELRQQALEAIEKWHEQWGLQYPQVDTAGILHDMLHLHSSW